MLFLRRREQRAFCFARATKCSWTNVRLLPAAWRLQINRAKHAHREPLRKPLNRLRQNRSQGGEESAAAAFEQEQQEQPDATLSDNCNCNEGEAINNHIEANAVEFARRWTPPGGHNEQLNWGQANANRRLLALQAHQQQTLSSSNSSNENNSSNHSELRLLANLKSASAASSANQTNAPTSTNHSTARLQEGGRKNVSGAH